MIRVHDSEIYIEHSRVLLWVLTVMALSALPAAMLRLAISRDIGDVVLLPMGLLFTFIGYRVGLKQARNPPLYLQANASGIAFDSRVKRYVIPWQDVTGVSGGKMLSSPMTTDKRKEIWVDALKVHFADGIELEGRGYAPWNAIQNNELLVSLSLLGGRSLEDATEMLDQMKQKYG